MSVFRRGRRNRSLGESLRSVVAEVRRIVSLEIELRKARVVRAIRHAALVAACLVAAAGLLALAGVAALAAIGLALATVLPGWAAALVVSGLLAVLAAAAAAGAVAARGAARRTGAPADRRPARSPAQVEADLADAHFRLEAEIDALTRRGDRHAASAASPNGGSAARSWRGTTRT